MKITMQVGQEGPDVSRVRSQEIEVDDDEGQRLVDADFATKGWASETPVTPSPAPAANPKPAGPKPPAKPKPARGKA